MVQTYSGCRPHSMAACRSSSGFFPLPSLICRSGTSRFANHNTVGTDFALPSLRCTQTLFHVFLLFFLIICLFCLFFFPFLFRMEILRSIGVACSGRTVPGTKGWMRDGRRAEERQREVAGEISIFNRQWGSFKTTPMCSLFQLGFDGKWSEARAG